MFISIAPLIPVHTAVTKVATILHVIALIIVLLCVSIVPPKIKPLTGQINLQVLEIPPLSQLIFYLCLATAL